MLGRVEGRIAIVTGSSNGIGRAISLLLAKEGATVICSDLTPSSRTPDTLPTHEEIVKTGGKSIFHAVNVTKEAEVSALVDAAVKQYGRLDIMINNAGMQVSGVPIWEFPEEDYDRCMEVNGKGVFLGVKHALRVMKDQEPLEEGDRGWVVNTGSIAGLHGMQRAVPYATSKHAVSGITKCAALESAPYRIHVNAVCPGFIQTDLIDFIMKNPELQAQVSALHPFKGLGEVADIAQAVLLLCETTWMTGVLMPVDGGYSAQ